MHSFCLMSNHFHRVLETPQPNLVAGMKRLLGTSTSGHNRRHKEFGHLLSGRQNSTRPQQKDRYPANNLGQRATSVRPVG